MTIERAADRAAFHGFHVLPVAGKLPAIAKGVHGASDQRTRVGFMFRNVQCDGLGIACGHPLKDGGFLAILDMDVQHDGDYHLAELEGEHGEMPDTLTVRTRSGGLHFYLRTEQPHRTMIGFRPGLEIRGQGAYCVAPPSPGYQVHRRAPIADAPAWLLAAAAPPERPVIAPRVDERAVTRRYVETAIERECLEMALTPEGQRNAQLNRSAYALARFVARGEADAAAVIQALTISAKAAGLRPREIGRTIRSAFSAREAA